MLDTPTELYLIESLFEEDSEGLESFASNMSARVGDVIRYYFTRFLLNLRTAFKTFDRSELETYLTRHRDHLKLVLTDPLINFKDTILPVPKGMIETYVDTLVALETILDQCHAVKLHEDLVTILKILEEGDYSKLPSPEYSKELFNQHKHRIGSLFLKNGLTHKAGGDAFDSMSEVSDVKDTLHKLVTSYYPEALKIHSDVTMIEKARATSKIDDEDAEAMGRVILMMAYRVSIFAVVLEHIQDMEHALVKSLELLRTSSQRHG